jgi:hypothetical protein
VKLTGDDTFVCSALVRLLSFLFEDIITVLNCFDRFRKQAPMYAHNPTTATSTQAVHAGEARFRAHHSLTVPVVQTAVYTFASTAELVNFTEDRLFWSEPEREEYGRYGNPTVRALEAKLAELEGAQDAIAVSSGMAAVTGTLLLLLQPGQHFILTDNCYHSTLEFSQGFLRRYGIGCTLVPVGDYAALEAAIRPETRLIFSESPTNPFMRCLDFPAPGGDRQTPQAAHGGRCDLCHALQPAPARTRRRSGGPQPDQVSLRPQRRDGGRGGRALRPDDAAAPDARTCSATWSHRRPRT